MLVTMATRECKCFSFFFLLSVLYFGIVDSCKIEVCTPRDVGATLKIYRVAWMAKIPALYHVFNCVRGSAAALESNQVIYTSYHRNMCFENQLISLANITCRWY